jgi:hypothetical protein
VRNVEVEEDEQAVAGEARQREVTGLRTNILQMSFPVETITDRVAC